MLERVLEPEVMDDACEAGEYDAMDHSAANAVFVSDLLQVCAAPCDVLDIGTGTARIPVELCCQVADCRVMAADLSADMLDMARYHIEINGLNERIQLDQCDAKKMHYQDGMFDTVLANGMLHHIPDPAAVIAEAVRVTAAGGLLFFRDLGRPIDNETLESLVATYAASANERQQALMRQSLHASLNADEVREIVTQLGFEADTVRVTSDRHWTWIARV